MLKLSKTYIRGTVADSAIIYKRGVRLFEQGPFAPRSANGSPGHYIFYVDGNYGDYTVDIELTDTAVKTACDCPYPGKGCKHVVAALLTVLTNLGSDADQGATEDPTGTEQPRHLTPEEIKQQAIVDRARRAKSEDLALTRGDMFKGEHLVESADGRRYTVTLHDPQNAVGHCSCPDYATNALGLCKHILFTAARLKRVKGFAKQLARERFPLIDLYWDSQAQKPRLYHEGRLPEALSDSIRPLFDETGNFIGQDPTTLLPLIDASHRHKNLRISPEVIHRLDRHCIQQHIDSLGRNQDPLKYLNLNAILYPYQREGVSFAAFKTAALIGDEMGLGKTLQAIALALVKKEFFGFSKVLVITMASLKDQWRREIERFSDEKALVIAGNAGQRQHQYLNETAYFKITNYEAVLRDTFALARFRPELVILDEAQRIKNFTTKTATAVKQIPRTHALVLTGTPLENKLEDVYSIIQFLDPHLLSPLWQFAADHFLLSRHKTGAILGYTNLDRLRRKLKPLVIRRKKEDVLQDLPEQISNTYYIDLHLKQQQLHIGYAQALAPYLKKKYLTPVDVRRIQELLLRMRQACNSTYLIDRNTNISPKLKELAGIIDDIAIQNQRKMVIFSEWTTMTFLIARQLSAAGVKFVELSGKIPVKKRQALIDEFSHNPDCRVFLSTDAGGTGLNLQAADCVVNFEMPWNPARLNQRIGRVNRIGQKSRCVNVINLVARNSIEENILAGIQLKTDLFQGVFDGGLDKVEFSREKRKELLNQLRGLIEQQAETAAGETIQEEIPEDTPHFLNPQVLNAPERQNLDFTAEQTSPETSSRQDRDAQSESAAPKDHGAALFAEHPPEKLATVLDSGMQFITGLLEMATGQKIQPAQTGQRMVDIDPDTGEVTLKFRLPGFGSTGR